MATYRVRQREHEDLVDDLLAARGIDAAQKDIFLNPDFVRDSHDPFLLPDMDRAVARVAHAQQHGEKIAVWSDYDADGLPAGVMLVEVLRALGSTTVHYVPHRHREGFGLNEGGLAELAGQGVKLVITADCGTSDAAAIAFANRKGMDVVVTDHHAVGALPEALAVINPHRKDSAYPFADLCGAGVAWKLVQAMLAKNRPEGFAAGQEKWLLDLVGIGTLSDMVPLLGENRMLAHFGLTVMRRARRPGLAALLRLLKIESRTLTEDDVGFMLSPRINAASRMGEPHVAARLLGTQDPTLAGDLARELEHLNDARKGVVAATVKEANKKLAELTPSPVIVLGSPHWRPGILGLVASSLVEAHHKPVFLWGREESETIKGSCRSDGSVNMVDCMQGAGDVLTEFGGHHGAGGFSVLQERVHELPGRLAAAYELVRGEPGVIERVVDRELPLSEVAHARGALKNLAPFGTGFEKPLFVIPDVSVVGVRTFGKQKNHLGVTLAHGDEALEGVAFFAGADSFSKKIEAGGRASVVGHVESDWQGRPRVRVIDFI